MDNAETLIGDAAAFRAVEEDRRRPETGRVVGEIPIGSPATARAPTARI